MIKIQRLSTCSFEQAVSIWNEGFEGYASNLTMNVLTFTAHMGLEGLSPEYSLMAFVDGEPAGILLNGIRTIDGKKVSWNGGTAVANRFRGKGVGKALVQHALDAYREQGVELATLEAISDNERAISLYQHMGYEIVDHLAFYSHADEFKRDPFRYQVRGDYRVKRGIPQDVQNLPFYQTMGAWQTQWQSVRDGESLIVLNAEGETIGYALHKRRFNEYGVTARIMLMQVGWDARYADIDDLISFILSEVYDFDLRLERSTVNFPQSHRRVVSLLLGAGFKLAASQVLMMRSMTENTEVQEEDAVNAESFSGI